MDSPVSSRLTFLSKFVYPVAVAGLLTAAFITGGPSDRAAVAFVGVPWFAFILYAYGSLNKVSVGPSPLGRRIRFMPQPELRLAFWKQHTIVDQIRQAVAVQGSVLADRTETRRIE